MEQITVRDVRNINKYNIIRTLMSQKDLLRSDIAIKNNISVMTVKNIIDDLLEKNIIYEKKAGSSFIGRKPSVLNISDTVGYVLAVDLTSKNRMCYFVYNIYKEKIKKKLYKCNPKKSFVDNLNIFLNMMKNEIEEARIPLMGIGVSIPGAYFADEDKIYNELILELNEIKLKKLIQEYFTTDNVIIDLDVKLAAFAELMNTEAHTKEKQNLFYLFLGEGIGSAMVINGEIYGGSNGFAGEIGQTLICCEQENDCNLESILSATVIQNEAYKELSKKEIKALDDQDEFNLDKIVEMYNAGDLAIRGYLENVLNILARVIYNIVRLFDPGRIIIGGIHREFCEIAAAKLKEKTMGMFVNKELKRCEIYVSKYEEGSAIIGCFEMVVNQWIDRI
ncbi:MAG: ROK family protein [Firmicutes bacterium]|nr:ROK family protein [Bacillota bacterium]